MFCKVLAGGICGITSFLAQVEVDSTYAMPGFDMVGLLGGRVAEQLVLGDISTVAKSDIDRASAIARSMVMEYGMTEELGTISYGTDQNEVFLGRDLGRGRNFSEEVGATIDREVKHLIDEAYKRA